MGGNDSVWVLIVLISISSNHVIDSHERAAGVEEKRADEGESKYTVKGVRDRESNLIFRLYKVTQIIPQDTNYPSDIAQYKQPRKHCAICLQDMTTLDRLCRNAISTLKLGEKYDIFYADGAPVEQTRAYRLQRGPSKVPIREKAVYARKCPTAPALYLTNGRSPRSVTVIMKSPGNRMRRFIQRHRRPYDMGI